MPTTPDPMRQGEALADAVRAQAGDGDLPPEPDGLAGWLEHRDRIGTMWSARIALRPGRDEDLQSHDGRRAPNPLLRRAMKAFASGDLSIRPLASLLDADPEQLFDELEPPRFTPPLDAEQQADAL